MARFITRDHRCTVCGHVTIYLHERDAEAERVPCEDCGAPADRILSATFIGDTSASYVDGTNRFGSIKATRKLEREAKKARRQGRTDDVKKLAVEISKAGRAK